MSFTQQEKNNLFAQLRQIQRTLNCIYPLVASSSMAPSSSTAPSSSVAPASSSAPPASSSGPAPSSSQ